MEKESELPSFVLVMGNTPFVRVIDFFLENRPFDYSKTQIARNSEVGWSTLHGIWKILEKNQLVKPTRILGKSQLYRLNEENPIVRKIIELDAKITETYADKAAEEELKIPIPIKRRR
ncbi:MAG: hypothetical protein HYT70_00240 [Candidatus Aenigmarchaeota archaeon]|nr:hypothetical protein [Candidatus Aenigmarchaeota archaeon]